MSSCGWSAGRHWLMSLSWLTMIPRASKEYKASLLSTIFTILPSLIAHYEPWTIFPTMINRYWPWISHHLAIIWPHLPIIEPSFSHHVAIVEPSFGLTVPSSGHHLASHSHYLASHQPTILDHPKTTRHRRASRRGQHWPGTTSAPWGRRTRLAMGLLDLA